MNGRVLGTVFEFLLYDHICVRILGTMHAHLSFGIDSIRNFI